MRETKRFTVEIKVWTGDKLEERQEGFARVGTAMAEAATTIQTYGPDAEVRVIDHRTMIEALYFDGDSMTQPMVCFGAEGYGQAWGKAMDFAASQQ